MLETSDGHDHYDNDDRHDRHKIKHENLLNEYKGGLFEYLVAQSLARIYRVEKSFITNIDPALNLLLVNYECYIRNNDAELLRELPMLAQEATRELLQHILQHISCERCLSPSGVYLVGRGVAGSEEKGAVDEADILLQFDNGDGEKYSLPISVKLCKHNSFVNTKNAGVQSFVVKYFPFQGAAQEQEELNQRLKNSFSQLFEELGEWPVDAGYSELPGELPPRMQERVRCYYHEVISEVYHILSNFYQRDYKLFVASLYPLCGLTSSKLLQLICHHGVEHGKRYIFKGAKVIDYDSLVLFSQQEQQNIKDIKKIKILELKDGLSSFEIVFPFFVLQIRVKPMNRFTLPGLKINCSVKY
ncbi:MAG: hypothetical protein HQK53_05165 [Oligoflexia bacterium]|nr:hypothetical protein [Oligoflexia bacterium]